MTDTPDSEKREKRHDATYWFRWVMVLPATGAAFLMAGILGAIPAFFVQDEWGLILSGPLCAIAWVFVAWATAPSHRVTTAISAFCVGAGVAAGLVLLIPVGFVLKFTMFTLTCAGGLGALAFCLPKAHRQKVIQQIKTVTSNSIKTIQNTATMKEDGMSEHQSIRQFIKGNIWAKLVTIVIVLVVAANVVIGLGRGTVDIITQEYKGLYMRMGRYIRTVEPGLHFKIPAVDQIIRVSVRERQGYIQHVDAMTKDNVIMRVSLQYTFEVTDPVKYRLEMDDPDNIILEFVQGKLRDIVNTISMAEVMQQRQQLGQSMTDALAEKESHFGVHFLLIQVQGTYPPTEVEEAIKQRMVSEQRTVAAEQEARQKEIIADADFYEAQKRTDAAKYEIEETAAAKKESINLLLGELSQNEALGEKYLEYLIAQELKSNSKWIISGSQVPEMHLNAEGGGQ